MLKKPAAQAPVLDSQSTINSAACSSANRQAAAKANTEYFQLLLDGGNQSDVDAIAQKALDATTATEANVQQVSFAYAKGCC